MTQDLQVRTKFDLFVGNECEGRLLDMKAIGEAFNYEGASYYVLNFWSLEKPFFLVPNRDQESRYTIFRKKIDTESRPVFQKPVGRAWVSEKLRTHLHLMLNFPRDHAFMSLFPDKS